MTIERRCAHGRAAQLDRHQEPGAAHEWGETKLLDAPPAATDLAFNWTQSIAQSKFACAVLGLYHGANGLEISKQRR